MVSIRDQVMQRKLRICIYGSTDAEPELQSFVARLTNAVLRELPSVIITQPNLSVMYEIGYAHAKGISPFLFCRRPFSLEKLPVYIAARNVAVVHDNEDLSDHILSSLQDVMREKRLE